MNKVNICKLISYITIIILIISIIITFIMIGGYIFISPLGYINLFLLIFPILSLLMIKKDIDESTFKLKFFIIINIVNGILSVLWILYTSYIYFAPFFLNP